MAITLVYRLSDRTRDYGDREYKMPASSVIDAHAWHASNPEHKGRVLFTTGTGPEASQLKEVTKIVLITKDGSHALYANVKACGRGNELERRLEGYDQPSQWPTDDYPDAHGRWYCLELQDVKPVKRGDLVDVDGVDVLTSIAGQKTWRVIAPAE